MLVEVILKDYSGLEYRLGVEFEAAIDQVNYQIDKDLELCLHSEEDSCDKGHVSNTPMQCRKGGELQRENFPNNSSKSKKIFSSFSGSKNKAFN